MSANAQYFDGSGTQSDPYLIKTAADLAQLATLVNAGYLNYNTVHYRLENDLDLSAYGSGFNYGKGWNPIGIWENDNDYFGGVFDGNNKKITGLYINDLNISSAGLFGVMNEDAVVKNLGIENINISGDGNVGGIAGVVYVDSKIENCYSNGKIFASFWKDLPQTRLKCDEIRMIFF